MLGGVRLIARRQATGPAEEARLRGERAELLVREFEAQTSGWFWMTDRGGLLTYLSEKVARQIAAEGSDPIGRPLATVFETDAEASGTERTIGFHLTSRTGFGDYSVRSGAGEAARWWSISGRPALDARGNFQGFVGSGSDLTEKRRAEAEIARLAMFDTLTGLANRQRMRLMLDQTLAQAASSYRGAGLLLLDLDRFKAVNDTLGHQAGDALLKQVAQRLGAAVGEAGIVGRLGGDEFQVLLPGEARADRLAELCRAIIADLSRPYVIGGSSATIGCSIGIAVAPTDGADAETLVRNADLALYAAKGAGRGVHRFFDDQMLAGAQSRKQLEEELRIALGAGALHLVYQPVIATDDERISGYEALVRWSHPQRGAISPADFVPIAEECGLIEALGEWVLRTACTEAAAWPGQVRVAVNVSPIQFANPAFPGLVAHALAQSGLAAERLELEITEGVFLNGGDQTERQFRALKATGVRLALDDFGTGYSSLGYLRSAPFDKIKIDQSFVKGSAQPGNRNAAIIAAIVTLARTMGMETTAEGVELQDEIALVRSLGCSHIQGYVYGAGVRADEAAAQIAGHAGHMAPTGFKSSRAPRTRMLRTARCLVGGETGDVRIRNISATGALIDGIEVDGEAIGMTLSIEVAEGQMVEAEVRWARDGRAGIAFLRPIDVDRLSQPPARLRRAG